MGRTMVAFSYNHPTGKLLIFPRANHILVPPNINYTRLRSIPVFYILSQSKESQTNRTWPFCLYPSPQLAAAAAAASVAS